MVILDDCVEQRLFSGPVAISDTKFRHTLLFRWDILFIKRLNCKPDPNWNWGGYTITTFLFTEYSLY